ASRPAPRKRMAVTSNLFGGRPVSISNSTDILRTNVFQKGKLLAITEQRLQIKFSADCAFAVARISQHLTARVNDQAAARVRMQRVFATAIDADDVSLIFNRPCPEQSHPVMLAIDRPACDDRVQVRAHPDG